MAYDELVAERVRQALAHVPSVTERKMFGGLAFLVCGNMCCGVMRSNLMLRLGKEGAADALREPHTRAMDFTGKPMKSMVYVLSEGYSTKPKLSKWVQQAVKFATSLPAKE